MYLMRTSMAVLGFTVFALGIATSANAALVTHWKLGEGINSTTPQTVTDSSGNGVDGVLGDTTAVETADADWLTTGLGTGKLDPIGTLGSVLNFSGSQEDHATFNSHAATFQALKEGTIALWARIDTAYFDSGPQALFTASDSGDFSSELRLYFNLVSGIPHDIRFGIRNDDVTLTAIDTANDIITPDEWFHVAVAVDSSGTNLYVDGVLAATSSSTAFLADVAGIDSVLLGANDDSGPGLQWELTGKLSDVQIYSEALPDTGIAFLANSANLGTAIGPVPEPSTLLLAFAGLVLVVPVARRRVRRK